jgi:hypothetical protein
MPTPPGKVIRRTRHVGQIMRPPRESIDTDFDSDPKAEPPNLTLTEHTVAALSPQTASKATALHHHPGLNCGPTQVHGQIVLAISSSAGGRDRLPYTSGAPTISCEIRTFKN